MLHEFCYFAPTGRKELLAFLDENKASSKILAGGTDLLVDVRGGKEKPGILVDIKKIPEYRIISFDPVEGLSIGAAVTCFQLISDRVIASKFPLIADAASRIGSPQLRNRATIAGNICTASPCADLGTALLALGASVETASAGRRRLIPLRDFFTGVKKTRLQRGEIVERIIVSPDMAGARGGMEKLKRIKGHDLALVSVAMIRNGNNLRIALGAAAPTPVVIEDLPASTPLGKVVEKVGDAIKPITDIRASQEFRLFMARNFVEKLYRMLAGDVATGRGKARRLAGNGQ